MPYNQDTSPTLISKKLGKTKDWSFWVPVIWVGAFLLCFYLFFKLEPVHFAAAFFILVLKYGGTRLSRIYGFFLPLILMLIVYDSMRYYASALRGKIHVAEPYLAEKTLFGIHTTQGILTPNEWWQHHLHPALDLIAGAFYLSFIPIFLAISAYFYFVLSRKGTATRSPQEVSSISSQIMWSFFWVNMVGYSTYYWYAAAPPWYVAEYGLGPADPGAVPSAAGCARFDQILGTNFFSGMYSKSANVFGAIPSLHVAYPLLAAIYSFRFRQLRVASSIFYLMMCFSAVYLNHHYIVDLIWGSLYAIATALGVKFYFQKNMLSPLSSLPKNKETMDLEVYQHSDQKSYNHLCNPVGYVTELNDVKRAERIE